jgi:hypothetical protein
MISLKKKYQFDKALAQAGAKMILGPDPETDYLLVRRSPSDSYYRVLSETLQANGDRLEELKKSDPEAGKELDLRLQCQVMARTIVVGWGSGIEDYPEYSEEACSELLFNYDDLRVEATIFSRNNANYPPKADIEKIKKK